MGDWETRVTFYRKFLQDILLLGVFFDDNEAHFYILGTFYNVNYWYWYQNNSQKLPQ